MPSTPLPATLSHRIYLIVGAALAGAVIFLAGYHLGGRKSELSGMPLMPRLSEMTQAPDLSLPPHTPAKAGRLEDLLPLIEAKVRADPGNIEQRLLLAQTYIELEKHDMALATLRQLKKDAPGNAEVLTLLAAVQSEEGIAAAKSR